MQQKQGLISVGEYMQTFITLIYIFAVVMAYVTYLKVNEYRDEEFARSFVLFSFLGTLFISMGLVADITPYDAGRPYYFLLIEGPVLLGIFCLESFLLPIFFGDSIEIPELNFSFPLFRIIMEIIGFIASILGIISFFL